MAIAEETVDEIGLAGAVYACDGDDCDGLVDAGQQFLGLFGEVEL
jgi:hypothetical protein